MADAELLVRQWLANRFPSPDRVVTETPGDLEKLPRVVQVARAGGPKRLTLDQPRMVFTWFAIAAAGQSAREVARAWAIEGTRAVELELVHAQLDSTTWCTASRVTSGPTFAPDSNTLVRKFVTTVSLSLRSSA